jgi:hypothetical protein
VRYLDEAGADALVRWFSTHPDLEDSDLVESVLEEIEGEGAWKTRWYSPGRDLTTGGWIIEPRPGLWVVVKEYSDEDPQRAFSLTWVGPTPDAE